MTRRRTAKRQDVLGGSGGRRGYAGGGLPVFSFGAGPPLLVLRGLTPRNANPRGLSRASEARMYRPLARGHTVHAVTRRPGLERTSRRRP